jgi:uncharacterized protein YbbC (DUF1343 family)
MGEKTASLRGKRLSDLIHGASINKPVSLLFYVLKAENLVKLNILYLGIWCLT